MTAAPAGGAAPRGGGGRPVMLLPARSSATNTTIPVFHCGKASAHPLRVMESKHRRNVAPPCVPAPQPGVLQL